MAAQRKTTPSPMPDREILNIDGAAAFLGVSVKTFSKALREGDVPARKVGREWKFSRQALIDWIGNARSAAFLDASDDGEPEEAPQRTRARSGAPRAPGLPAARRRRPDDGFSVDEL